MKGIILSGGSGTRLSPLTCTLNDQGKLKKAITNKHLLSIFSKQMILHPVKKLYQAGITDIMIITGIDKSGEFLELLGDGHDLMIDGQKMSVDLTFRIQSQAGGIAQALGMCEAFVNKDKCVVILGDNLIEDDITPFVEEFKNSNGAKVLLKEVDDPYHFGVARLEGDKVVEIIEKPKNPPSNLAVIGCYFYDSDVWSILPNLKPSHRNELEITDVNNEYISQGNLTYGMLSGFWLDSGSSFRHLLKASMWTAKKEGIDLDKILSEI